MKKLLLSISFFTFLVFSIGSTSATWYGNHSVGYTEISGCDNSSSTPTGPYDTSCLKNCDTDGDALDNPAVANNNSSSTLVPETDTEYPVPNSGDMRCLYWDASAPNNLSITYSNTNWTNSNVTITVKAQDVGGSGIVKIELFESANGSAYSSVKVWNYSGTSPFPGVGGLITENWTRTAISSSVINYKYKIIVTDGVGLTSQLENTDYVQIDTIAPSNSDIDSSGGSILADVGLTLTVPFNNPPSDGGSDIVTIDTKIEDKNNQANFLDNPDSGENVANLDLSKVDNFIVAGQGYREYTLRVIKICDQAGNCSYPTINIPYKVYANTQKIGTRNVTTNQLANLTNIADGTNPKNLTITLKDIYSNAIIKADNGRQINFTFNMSNNLALDQYSHDNNAVFFTIPSDSSTFVERIAFTHLSENVPFNNQPSLNGTYLFQFKVYAPTYLSGATDGRQYSDPIFGNFTINSINFSVTNDSIGGNVSNTFVFSSNIDFIFKPLFEANFSGGINDTGYILDGAYQETDLNITKNLVSPSVSSPTLYLEFGSGARLVSDDFDLYKDSINTYGEGHTGAINNWYYTGIIDGNSTESIFTKLTSSGTVTTEQLKNNYFSSHISYILPDLTTVVLNSDIIGKQNYWHDDANGSVSVVGLKVLGKTHSKSQLDLVEGQSSEDLHIFGDIDKSSLKRSIRENAYGMIKFIDYLNEGGSYISDLTGYNWLVANQGKRILNNRVLYIKGDGVTPVVLGDGSDLTIEGKKTIIIYGGDLYIKSKILNSSIINNILGIIVLKDENGNGGKVYIDPEVTKIYASIYADKSLMSYKSGIGELDSENGGTLEVLNNQLFIYGQVFSENTIGGSRMSPIKCPYYLDSTICDKTEAQKYDLNYLRRYTLYDDKTNYGTSCSISGNPDGVIDDCDPPVLGGQSVFVELSPYHKYPVVIMYNPIIQITPPPLFNQ